MTVSAAAVGTAASTGASANNAPGHPSLFRIGRPVSQVCPDTGPTEQLSRLAATDRAAPELPFGRLNS